MVIKSIGILLFFSLVVVYSYAKPISSTSSQQRYTISEIVQMVNKPLTTNVQSKLEKESRFDYDYKSKYDQIEKDADFILWSNTYFYSADYMYQINSTYPFSEKEQKFENLDKAYDNGWIRIITDKFKRIRVVIRYLVDKDSSWVGYASMLDSDYEWLKEYAVKRINFCDKVKKTGYIVFEAKYGYVIIGFSGGYPDPEYKYITYRAFIDKGFVKDPRMPLRDSSLPKIDVNDYINFLPKDGIEKN